MESYTLDTDVIPLGSGEPRSKGLHLTDILKSIEHDMGWTHDPFTDPWLTMDLGFVWEEQLSRSWADRQDRLGHEMIFRPGEVKKDGIIASPDGIGPNVGIIKSDGTIIVKPSPRPTLYEYKLTWKSIRHRVVDNWYYVTQAKSYLHMTNLTECFWHIGYLMGDYRGSGPLYRQCYGEFTKEELDENWTMVISHAKEKGML